LAFPVALLLAANPIQPIVDLLHAVLSSINGVVHNYGWSLILLALIIKAAFWPLNTMQFKAMLKTQKIAPQLKALQARHKNDKERLNTETMALYKETGANPLAGCLPILLQMPILISLYWAVISDKALFASQTWLWIGSKFASTSPYHLLASSLAAPDYVLLAFYTVSMYFSVRFTSPAVDPQQAQQQRIMAFISPAMIGYFGIRYAWPSALIIYWLSFNVFTMAQQLYLIRKYHTNPAAIGPHPESVEAVALAAAKGGSTDGTASLATGPAKSAGSGGGGSRAARRRRSSRR
jgi:YidC/Oxa1 family membrane protein insertase